MSLFLKAQQLRDGKNRSPGKALSIVSLMLFLVAVFSAAIVPINSHDFWWHLVTGEYILHFQKLPDQDPFTYTSMPDDPDYPGRPLFVLRQFWLSQVLYALVHNAFGLPGVIIARGLLYCAIAMTVLFIVAARPGAGISPAPLVLFCLATRTALEDSDRPQTFSFLFALLLIAVVEWAIRKKKKWPLFLNIPIMAVAANMHGGYVVGVVLLCVYLVFIPFEERLRPLRGALFASTLLALLASYFNPNQWKVFGEVFSMVQAPLYVSTIQEYLSPLKILPHTLSNPGWLAYWMLVLLSIFAALYFFGKRRYSEATLLLITLGASLYGMRFTYFFIPLGSAFTALFLQEAFFSRINKRTVIDAVAIPLFLFALLFRPGHPNNLGLKVILRGMSYPVSAAAFISREGLPQPVFNDMLWGGYLEWRLWPAYRMFIDTRQLINRTYADYLAIMYGPQGIRLLNAYGAATVITSGIDPYAGQIIPLVRNLYHDDEWSLVYRDGQAVVFVRRILAAHELPKKEVYEEVLAEAAYWRRFFPWVTAYEATIAEAENAIESP